MAEPMRDPIVEEIHQVRADLAERFGGDVRAIVSDLRAKQSASGREYVSLPPKTPSVRPSSEAEGAA